MRRIRAIAMKKMARMMISCNHAALLMSKKQHQKLSLKERLNLKMHLLSCYICRRYEKQLDLLNKAFHILKKRNPKHKSSFSLSEDCKKKMQQSIDNHIDIN